MDRLNTASTLTARRGVRTSMKPSQRKCTWHQGYDPSRHDPSRRRHRTLIRFLVVFLKLWLDDMLDAMASWRDAGGLSANLALYRAAT